MSADKVGFVGLGNMGSVLAGNLVGAGHDVMIHDVSGSGRSPDGAEFVGDVTQLARRADVVVLSLPDGLVSEQVARANGREAAAAGDLRGRHLDGWCRRRAGDRRSPHGGGSHLRRRARVGRRRWSAGARAVGHVCGHGRGLPGGRASPGRVERPAAPGRRYAWHDPGVEARQQLPVGDRRPPATSTRTTCSTAGTPTGSPTP